MDTIYSKISPNVPLVENQYFVVFMVFFTVSIWDIDFRYGIKNPVNCLPDSFLNTFFNET
ncbi:hypothetical protein D1164_16520 [Mariniphaga sediminis]|uniref:Uncharacterized protein n=1 Tax=Mariniphaga sediminis TaxID=1628158 RepID=A0A399CXL0_9BACT|nr:hypothetical protein D1164_16520 [Mariniphaga sediminis]